MAIAIHPHTFPGVATADIERWRRVPTAIVADVSGGSCLIGPNIRPLRPPGHQSRLFGFAVTALCIPPDFGAVLHAIDVVQKGDVLVIAAHGHRDHAMIGEILGGQLRRKGAAGIVCDGAVRDVSELSQWQDLPVFARHTTPLGPTAWQLGEVNAEADVGGRRIAPGDLIIGDDDGLVCLSPLEITSLIDAAEAKLALESEWQASLAGGASIKQTFRL